MQRRTTTTIDSGDIATGTGTAIFEDSFTIDTPGRSGQSGSMTFKLKIAGILTATTRTAGAADPSYSRVALSINGGSIWDGSERIHPGGTTNIVTGQPFLNQEVSVVIPFTFGIPVGIQVWLDATSYIFGNWGGDAIADIGHTLQWGGIVSVTDSGGSPVTNHTTVTGSGTDYSGPILDLPILTLVPLNPGQLLLSWSTNYPAFTLESAAALSNNWQTVTNSTSIAGEQHTLTIDASGTSQFFRLRKN